MEYSVQKLSKSKIEVAVSIEKDEWQNDIKEGYNKNKHKYSVEGFRKGKVPMQVLVAAYGKQFLYEDAIDIAVDKAYEEIMNKENFEVVARPELDVKDVGEEGLKFVIAFTVSPEFELGQYTGLTFKKDVATVTDEEVNAVIDKELNDRARLIEKDGEAENGDTVVLDYSGSVNGVKFDGGTAQNQTLELGSGMFIPGFEEQIVGMKKGDSKDITVTFPENYGEASLAGKEAVFAITIHEVQRKEVPELDDEFVKDIDDELNTVEEWKNKIRDKILQDKEKNADIKLENDILEKIAENTEIEIPDCMIEDELDYRIQEMEHSMAQYGLKFEDYLKYTGETIEKIKEEKREEAVRNVKIRLIFDAICKKEEIKVEPEELKEKLADVKDEQRMKEMMNYYVQQIIVDKLFAFLKANNTIEDETVSK